MDMATTWSEVVMRGETAARVRQSKKRAHKVEEKAVLPLQPPSDTLIDYVHRTYGPGYGNQLGKIKAFAAQHNMAVQHVRAFACALVGMEQESDPEINGLKSTIYGIANYWAHGHEAHIDNDRYLCCRGGIWDLRDGECTSFRNIMCDLSNRFPAPKVT